MFDATCPKCQKRFGWSGKLTDKPPCPRCGHQDSLEELEAAEAKMEAFQNELFGKEG